MNQKKLFSLIITILLNLSFVNAAGFDSTDTFTSDSSSGTDAKTFEDRNLDFTIQSSNIMVACYDWYKTCGGTTTYNTCFAANSGDFDDCEAYDSWLTGMGYTTDSTPETQDMDTSNEANGCIDAVYYKNCDGQGGGSKYSVTERQYLIFSRRKFDCDGGNPSWYTYDAEGYVAPYDYDYKDEISCPANKKCSEDDDDDYVYTYNGAITNPCRWDDGQLCSDPSDCWSNDCSGNHWEYVYDCETGGDGAVNYDRHNKDYDDGCGGAIRDAGGDTDEVYSCVTIYGSGYVCDTYDPQTGNQYSSQQQICNKNLGEECSATSDCWHYNKPVSGETYCDYGGHPSTKHCIYSCYVGEYGDDFCCAEGSGGCDLYNDCTGYYCDCTSDKNGAGTCDPCLDLANTNSCDCDSECDSDRCDTTCQAKLGNGQSCNEDSDCSSDNCCSNTCQASCTPYINLTDDWTYSGSSSTDDVIFTEYEIFAEVPYMRLSADFVCYDWNEDGTYDNCYYDSDGCGGSCGTESCNSYSIPNNMDDGWKVSCNIDGGPSSCVIGEDVASRICGTCDGVNTSTIMKDWVEAIVYYDCDNSTGRQGYEFLTHDEYYVVKPKQYKCDGVNYKTRGKFNSTHWVIWKQDQSCGATKECDPNHDEQSVDNPTDPIPDPCRTTNGNSCTVDDDCISDNCDGGTCAAAIPDIDVSPDPLVFNIGY